MVPKFRKGDLVVLRLKEIVVSDTSSRRIIFKCFGRVGTIEGIVYFAFGVDYDVRVSCGDGSEYVVRVNEHDLGEFHAPDYRSMYSAIKKSPVIDYEIRTDGVFYVLKDGSRWNVVTGEKMPDSSQAIDSIKVRDALHVPDLSRRIDTPLQGIIEAIGKKIPSFVDPNRYVLRVDLGKVYAKMPESESKPESKMTKERCIKLLEAYRAEREKVAKGRKFERCLRDSVVNEALERAIQLLKG